MKKAIPDLLGTAGFCLFSGGVYLQWGAGVALLVGGALLMGGGFIAGAVRGKAVAQ